MYYYIAASILFKLIKKDSLMRADFKISQRSNISSKLSASSEKMSLAGERVER